MLQGSWISWDWVCMPCAERIMMRLFKFMYVSVRVCSTFASNSILPLIVPWNFQRASILIVICVHSMPIELIYHRRIHDVEPARLHVNDLHKTDELISTNGLRFCMQHWLLSHFINSSLEARKRALTNFWSTSADIFAFGATFNFKLFYIH